jgi:hypothetical protein
VRKAFRGSEFLYTLRLRSGETVLAHVPSHHDHKIGEWIGIRAEVDTCGDLRPWPALATARYKAHSFRSHQLVLPACHDTVDGVDRDGGINVLNRLSAC